MGGNESSISGGSRASASDMYLPVVGTRMNNEKVMSQLRAASQLTRPTRRNHIVRTAFTAIWSIHTPDGDKPGPRTGHFCATCEELNIVLTGLGVTDENEYLNDFWALDQNTLRWRQIQLTGDLISNRAHASATVAGKILYIFGGFNDPTYFNDLFAIDLSTGVCQAIQASGNMPTPRREAILEFYNGRLFLWGGFDGLWPSDLFVLDLSNLVWAAFQQEIQGRTGVSYQRVEDKIYCFGAAKTGGLLQIDLTNLTVSLVQTIGSEPPCSIVNSTMVHFDNYLLVIGGKAQIEWTYIYACDLTKMWWFVLHVLPDGETVSQVDGSISDLGMFMLPRPHSMGAAYCPNSRSVVAFLGCPKKEPSPLFILAVGEALGVMNMRTDMLEILNKAAS
jgi:hypothetical protein